MTTTSKPAPPRLPTWEEMDEMCGRHLLEGVLELLEEESRAKIVRLLQARSRQLDERDRRRRGIRLVYDRDAGNTE